MRKRVADLLIETLQAAGVRTCYGIVGDTLNRIAHAIDRSAIDWVHMRHEEAGAFAAAAEALLTGRPQRSAGRRPKLCSPAVSRPVREAAVRAVSTSSTASMRLIATAPLSS